MRFFHGSHNPLSVNLILTGRGNNYENDWKHTDFFTILEKYRPKNLLSHKESVFLCHHPDDIDNAGGGTDYICEIKVIGKLQRHDMNWCTEISCLISDGFKEDSEEIITCAHNYWIGVSYKRNNVWEYLTDKALILSCYEFDEGFIEEKIPHNISDKKFNKFKETLEINNNLSDFNNKPSVKL